MELVCHINLDAELVARRCLSAAAFGGEVSEETKEATDKDLERGLIAVNQLMVCDPYAAGNSFTLADMYTFYSFGLINMISQKMFSKDPLANYPKIQRSRCWPAIPAFKESKQKISVEVFMRQLDLKLCTLSWFSAPVAMSKEFRNQSRVSGHFVGTTRSNKPAMQRYVDASLTPGIVTAIMRKGDLCIFPL